MVFWMSAFLRKTAGLQVFCVFPSSFKERYKTRFTPEHKQVLNIAASMRIQSVCLRTILIPVHQTFGTAFGNQNANRHRPFEI